VGETVRLAGYGLLVLCSIATLSAGCGDDVTPVDEHKQVDAVE